jgi:hypothetical protein
VYLPSHSEILGNEFVDLLSDLIEENTATKSIISLHDVIKTTKTFLFDQWKDDDKLHYNPLSFTIHLLLVQNSLLFHGALPKLPT